MVETISTDKFAAHTFFLSFVAAALKR